MASSGVRSSNATPVMSVPSGAESGSDWMVHFVPSPRTISPLRPTATQISGSEGVQVIARTVASTPSASKLTTVCGGVRVSSNPKSIPTGSALTVASWPAAPPAISRFGRGQAITRGVVKRPCVGISSSAVFAYSQPLPGV